MDEIISFVDNSYFDDIITIDFAKAFDTISEILRNKLLYLLQTYGICGKLKLWIKEFLFNRSFNVTLNHTSSKKYNVTNSVPLDLKLASLLYILCANCGILMSIFITLVYCSCIIILTDKTFWCFIDIQEINVASVKIRWAKRILEF